MRKSLIIFLFLFCLPIFGCSKPMEMIEIESRQDVTKDERKSLEKFVFEIFIPLIQQTNISKLIHNIPYFGFYTGGLVQHRGQEIEELFKEKTGIMYRYLYNQSSQEGMPGWLRKAVPFSLWLKDNYHSGKIKVGYSEVFFDKALKIKFRNAHIIFVVKTNEYYNYVFNMSYIEGKWFFSGVSQ